MRTRLRAVMCVSALLICTVDPIAEAKRQSKPTQPTAGVTKSNDSLTVDTLGQSAPAVQKSPQTAFRYSLLSTLITVPTVVFTGPGLIFGPSTGYFYGGMPGRAWIGIGLRVVAIGGIVSSFAICGWDCGKNDEAYDLAWAVLLSSSTLLVVSTVYDIATVKRSVRHHNERLAKKGLSLAPAYWPKNSAIGLRVTLKI